MGDERKYRSGKVLKPPNIGFLYAEDSEDMFENPSDCQLTEPFTTDGGSEDESDGQKKASLCSLISSISVRTGFC